MKEFWIWIYQEYYPSLDGVCMEKVIDYGNTIKKVWKTCNYWIKFIATIPEICPVITHWGLVMQHGVTNLDQHSLPESVLSHCHLDLSGIIYKVIPVFRHKLQFKKQIFLQENVPENVIHKLSAILFRPHWIISLGPLLLTWINSITAWISNHMLSKVGDEITCPFPNYNGFTVEVWEWISKFTSHFIMDVITYPYVNNRDHWRKESHM